MISKTESDLEGRKNTGTIVNKPVGSKQQNGMILNHISI